MPVSSQATDVDLLQGLLKGDEHAFTVLYHRWQGRIYRFAAQMTGSSSLAEEVTQDAFMTLMREARSFDPSRGTLQAYLYGIARNYVLRCLSRERAYVPFPGSAADGDGDCLPADVVAPSDPLSDLTRQENINRVRRAVQALPANYREVVVLCELHELSYAEAAATLGCAVGTVRSRLHRGRELLAQKVLSRQPVPRLSASVL